MRSTQRQFSILFLRWWIVVGLLVTSSSNPLQAQEEEEVEEEQPWNVSLGTRFMNRYTRFGVDLDQDQPALSFEGGIYHTNGFSFGAEAISGFGTNGGYQQSLFHVGYKQPIGKVVTLFGVFTYHAYKSDTLNVLAGLSSTLTLGGTFNINQFLVSVSYDLFFGGGSANYVSAGVSTSCRIGSLALEPSINTIFVSQTVDVSLLPKNRGQGKGAVKKQGTTTTTTTITGLSNLTISVAFNYPLGKGFTVSFTPVYDYSPTDLAVRTSQFLWSGGLSYSIDF
ncbi:MAG: hypothetical protein NTX44_03830 [Ignavibacteriales bacterium]|nr:hypothetical protein [Ignavibacteriales bacterium]